MTRARSIPRPAVRLLAAASLGLVTLISPLESGLLPGRLGDLLEPQTAAAQTIPAPSFAPGTPDPCPTRHSPWRPAAGDSDYGTASECTLELPACPESPLVSGTFMRLSVPAPHTTAAFVGRADPFPPVDGLALYPEFCEERVRQADYNARYDVCEDLTGYAVMGYDDGGPACRVLTPMDCPAGMHRSGAQFCRAVQRRRWTCDTAAGYLPSNAFNSCYLESDQTNATHPPCGPGSPDFPVSDCESYVDRDFLMSPGSLDCATAFDTRTPHPAMPEAPSVEFRDPQQLNGPARAHWCEYDRAVLNADCHRTDGTAATDNCQTEQAVCIKRASRTGGCDRVAATIHCRALQAAFAQGVVTDASDVSDEGCNPCPSLPFSMAPAPANCPQQVRVRYTGSPPRGEVIMRIGLDWPSQSGEQITDADFAIAAQECEPVRTSALEAAAETLKNTGSCRDIPVCADPPRGGLSYTSEHHSGQAVVNSPVVVQVKDVPVVQHQQPSVSFLYPRTASVADDFFAQNVWSLHYADATPDLLTPRVQTFSKADETRPYASVSELVSATYPHYGYECAARVDPLFNVVAVELWPDRDADEIKQLFGDDALHWWEGDPDNADVNGLDPAQQRARVAARGIAWYPTATPDQLAERARELTTEVQCVHVGDRRTCHWVPSRSGYYKLTGVGAWELTRTGGGRQWQDAYVLVHSLERALQNPLIQFRVRQLLASTGLAPAAIGLKEVGGNLSAVLDSDDLGLDAACLADPDLCFPDREPLFTEELAAAAACPELDLRTKCEVSLGVANLTETEPVGVIVNEVRVITVTSSQP